MGKEAETAKVHIRKARKAAKDEIKGLLQSGLSEDMGRRAEAAIQERTDGHIDRVDAIFTRKESDIMKV